MYKSKKIQDISWLEILTILYHLYTIHFKQIKNLTIYITIIKL